MLYLIYNFILDHAIFKIYW